MLKFNDSLGIIKFDSMNIYGEENLPLILCIDMKFFYLHEMTWTLLFALFFRLYNCTVGVSFPY